MLTKIEAWFLKKGGFAHVAAATWGGLVLVWAAVPAFRSLVLAAYTATPHWFHDFGAAAVGIAAWYFNSNKTPKDEGAK